MRTRSWRIARMFPAVSNGQGKNSVRPQGRAVGSLGSPRVRGRLGSGLPRRGQGVHGRSRIGSGGPSRIDSGGTSRIGSGSTSRIGRSLIFSGGSRRSRIGSGGQSRSGKTLGRRARSGTVFTHRIFQPSTYTCVFVIFQHRVRVCRRSLVCKGSKA